MRGAALHREVEIWLDRMSLLDRRNKRVETLSKGMVQKVQFIAAVITRPDLLILDEPFTGLDPVNVELIRETVLRLRSEGTTILFSTHDMSAAEQMCDTIFMIYRGRKVLDGTLSELQAAYGEDTIRIGLEDSTPLQTFEIPGLAKIGDHGRFQDVRYSGDPMELLQAISQRHQVIHFEMVRPSLHDIFLRIASPGRGSNGSDREARGNE